MELTMSMFATQADYWKARAELAERNVQELIAAAREAIPAGEHPKDETPSNWAWQIRGLGADRNAAYAQLTKTPSNAKVTGRPSGRSG